MGERVRKGRQREGRTQERGQGREQATEERREGQREKERERRVEKGERRETSRGMDAETGEGMEQKAQPRPSPCLHFSKVASSWTLPAPSLPGCWRGLTDSYGLVFRALVRAGTRQISVTALLSREETHPCAAPGRAIIWAGHHEPGWSSRDEHRSGRSQARGTGNGGNARATSPCSYTDTSPLHHVPP